MLKDPVEQAELVAQLTDEIELMHETSCNDMRIDHVLEGMVKEDEKNNATEAYREDNDAYNKMNAKLIEEANKIGELRVAKHTLEAEADYEYDLWKDSIIEKEMEQGRFIPEDTPSPKA